MKFIEIILSIFLKMIMIIWGIISLFLLSIISIVVYIIFKLKFKLFKRKFKKFSSDFNINNIFHKQDITEKDKPYKNKAASNQTYNCSIKTIKRKLETKDGEIN